MQRALVIGTVSSTVKHPSLVGCKLLVVQPLMADARSPDGDPLIAVDGVGAGVGESVMITSDGVGARQIVKHENTPVRWTIIGIADA